MFIHLYHCYIVHCFNVTTLLWNHFTGSLLRRQSNPRCCALYAMTCIIKLQTIWEICSRREQMLEHQILTSFDFPDLYLWIYPAGEYELCTKHGDQCSSLTAALVGWLLQFYVLVTSEVIPGQVPTRESVHSWQPYSAAPLGNQVDTSMTQYPTQSHYPATELTIPYPILLMSCTRLENDKYQLHKSLV